MIPKAEFSILSNSKILKSTENLKKLVIAIDGPAAAGKSTTSKLVAKRLEYLHVNTGAMYRAMTLKVLESNISLDETDEIGRLAQKTEIRLVQNDDELRVVLDGRDVTRAIRSRAVTKAVSPVSSIDKVRTVMVREQRKIGREGGIVLEGRDIGTVVFPDADLKIFMIADVDERARRRKKDLETQGTNVPIDELVEEITQRDLKDSRREISPLRKADDAIIVDTSNMTIEEQVDFIVAKAKKIISV